MTQPLLAPAKVNLFLHVVGRRDDGYHVLDSLVAFAGVGDLLRFEAADSLTLTVEGPQAAVLAGEADNIVLKAARRLAEAGGVAPRAAIYLDKRLPVASGIGGGSADAAAALRGLSRLWGVSLTEEAMGELALGLGADVPVCLYGRPASMGGIGERLDPAPSLPPAWLVLVNPGRPLSTPAVFRRRAEMFPGGRFSRAAPLAEPPADAVALALALSLRGNDLMAAAISVEPEVDAVLRAISATEDCLLARMSGSGATCFGLFASPDSAGAAARRLEAAHPGWWVAAARLLDDATAASPPD
ncbi:MAG: 4-(cytidine 5'-diphospho)-2-C-methyl-D-erythritol kinase [Alphaproteobacteria bacterium]|nr:4-(cytidine 5'-diphospho)-2-C-methyl-D-erythritol kinase [Alphaproteobacteria bacterium]